jgi:AraC family transcriptional regulator
VTLSPSLACGCPTKGLVRNVGSLTLRQTVCAPGCSLGKHSHPDPRIVMTLSGHWETRHSETLMNPTQYDAVYRPSFSEHLDSYALTTRCITIVLPANFIERERLGRTAFSITDEAFLDLPSQLSFEMTQANATSGLVLEALAWQIVAHLLRRRDTYEHRRPAWIRSVRDRIEEEYVSPPTLQQVSIDVNREPTYVATAFKRHYGKTIGEYVRDIRMWHAQRLVAKRMFSFTQIAHQTGFSDQSHFCRLFRKRFTVSPGNYRRRSARADRAHSTRNNP